MTKKPAQPAWGPGWGPLVAGYVVFCLIPGLVWADLRTFEEVVWIAVLGFIPFYALWWLISKLGDSPQPTLEERRRQWAKEAERQRRTRADVSATVEGGRTWKGGKQ